MPPEILIATVSGAAGAFAGNTTTDLAEGTNLYYTDARARGSITIANSGTGYGSLGYVSGTGVLTYTVVTDANIRGTLTVAAGSGLTYSSATGQFGTSAIPNSQLAFSSVTVGSTSISLGTNSVPRSVGCLKNHSFKTNGF